MKRPRSSNDEFDVKLLCAELAPYARVKDLQWDWEFSQYAKTRRSQAPDRLGLEKYQEFLKTVLRVAPGGLPSQVRLREVFMYLDQHHCIMAADLRELNKEPCVWANDCCDRVRLMLRHIRDLKLSRSTFLSAGVKELVDMLQVASPPVEEQAPVAEQAPVRRRLLKKVSSTASVVLCNVTCKCSICRRPDIVDVDRDTSALAMDVRSPVPVKPLEFKAALPPQPARRRPSTRVKNVKVIMRQKPHHEGYLLVEGKYWAGLTEAKCRRYDDVVEQLAKEIDAGLVTDKGQAKLRLAQLVQMRS